MFNDPVQNKFEASTIESSRFDNPVNMQLNNPVEMQGYYPVEMQGYYTVEIPLNYSVVEIELNKPIVFIFKSDVVGPKSTSTSTSTINYDYADTVINKSLELDRKLDSQIENVKSQISRYKNNSKNTEELDNKLNLNLDTKDLFKEEYVYTSSPLNFTERIKSYIDDLID